jgi:hypothetical protein
VLSIEPHRQRDLLKLALLVLFFTTYTPVFPSIEADSLFASKANAFPTTLVLDPRLQLKLDFALSHQ